MCNRRYAAVSAALIVGVTTLVPNPAFSQGRLRSARIVSPTFPTPALQARADCLHGADESSEQATRRRQALTITRAINTAQARQRATNGKFADDTELRALPDIAKLIAGQAGEVAPGWQLRLATTEDEYVLSFKDVTDPCGFAYFSDDGGIIYSARPIQ
jgi:hypothetical protein